MTDDARIPAMTPRPQPPDDEYRRAATLRRTVDRATGELETREQARRRYREEGLRTPDLCDPYYDA
jgi:hypothetical protein